MSTLRRSITTKNCASFIALALAAHSAPAFAQDADKPITAWEASRQSANNDLVTTGVAKARDRLDSATSTSSFDETEIAKVAPRSLDDLLRHVPGIRVEGGAGQGLNAYTVRGLPLVNGGAKYLQIQEDGMPVLEFGDLANMGPDAFVRYDLNVASIDSIRGGSASTFASNAPGGVLNLISKTGEVEGGSVQLSAGLDYESNRVDFDYGGRLSENWRFHVGGFYRQGEGPREAGYTTTRGGQIKVNVTREFDGGYIRFYGKVLDDKSPVYIASPMRVTGTNDNPKFAPLANFNAVTDTMMSRNITSLNQVDERGNVVTNNIQDGYRVDVKSVGADLKFSLGDWNFTERFRYSDISGEATTYDPQISIAAGQVMLNDFVRGGSLRYATGPNAGATANPATIGGNGLLALTTIGHTNINSLDNATNDFRASRVWEVGGGDLTTTAGIYNAHQKIDRTYYGSVIIQDIVGNGNSSLIDVLNADGTYAFRNGTFSYDDDLNKKRRINVDYDVIAPYGSFNFHKGKLAIGGSIRFDIGHVSGSVAQANSQFLTFDVDGNGSFDKAELGASNPYFSPQGIPYIGANASQPVDYRYDYVSYSVSANYRVSESLSLFARHSLGGRAGADSLLFSPAISATSGALLNRDADHDSVRQTEGGFKFRSNNITANLTGFYATTKGTYLPSIPDQLGIKTPTLVSRGYRTYGAEFEGSVRQGPFSVVGNLTLTGGEITKAENPALVGNTPRRQATLLYTVTPQYDTDLFTIGASVQGQTSAYSDDVNLLKMPGFTTVGLFAQIRPVDRLVLSVNASNVFNKTAIMEVSATQVPTGGVAGVRTLYGRLISTSARFFF